ncbi:5-methyltetrahydropteroyltriglutamate--homocysteine S-methyltransferase [Rathayibacter toxicus]|uniref:5-methyltetrahydropteroyltriglutamate--homocysteine S-methyltransferase n=1 Tax=Rathayibacter toxicus TaxID=145458 RepID=A0A0C5BGR9_9MICO|nr:5-methyltetrahydropteroyltriglutamate--homocysteine S-methyltransferase [Rathayibacter toxicus]AJM77410.1 5-methyltetrahydropteroyltriglutamate--homocysteine methyltransferase [Rathayibacter toxicus]ALS56691.1 5-methyltetrahydropteroyltriglutamate--homocysteine methyltransferase [Rathayibacter toxicus]KKM45815.1 5-methyltetrahydropteroyltriglutamate--homocysteine methyltransferase [Rathayibacter toxicus]PPG22318.1 5-methyltetrahydropteroyltriglutamate--homocysteine S-methyltransferase [Ratha
MSVTAPAFPTGTVLGYPRIGRRRELKRAIESFWAGESDAVQLEATAAALRAATRERLHALGLGRDDSSIPEAHSLYDQILDTTLMVGAVPTRFADLVTKGSIDLAGAFTLARGAGARAPLEMTKWFDSNYHYLVPEIGPETVFSLVDTRRVREVEEARAAGFTTRPVLVGPVTYLLLAKPSEEAPTGFAPLSRLSDLVPVYVAMLAQLRAAGAEWVQLDEPALVSDSLGIDRETVLRATAEAYRLLSQVQERPSLFVAAPYGDLGDAVPLLAEAGVEAVGIDLVKGSAPAAAVPETVLVAGVIDGHNVWRGDLDAAFAKVEALRSIGTQVAVSSSTSLFHVPHDVTDEPELDARLASWLAFADQKVQQVATLARGVREGREAIAASLRAATDALEDRRSAPGVRDGSVRSRIAALRPSDYQRVPADERRVIQEAELGLPQLPTTTIGSFPQTREIRSARAAVGRGDLSPQEYLERMRAEIERVVRLQEDIGLDVLVHGEPERNDMVQYFAEHLDGFAVTRNGWVQSYGSRCTRPSLLWGDVSRPSPITVEWSRYAQSLTERPVKGMLTGPVTILAWSFVRDDQPLAETAAQVALSLRDEIADLERAGIRLVQVDEPALRELLPLETAAQPAYLRWSVDAFRLATAGAASATQIHTHLCYSEFGSVIDAIDQLDADVTSIEAARSRMEVVADLERSGFARGIGPGVYDIHSPRVPSEDELAELVDTALDSIPAGQLWINPDCGLKTRGYEETVASLRAMVVAATTARGSLEDTVAV